MTIDALRDVWKHDGKPPWIEWLAEQRILLSRVLSEAGVDEQVERALAATPAEGLSHVTTHDVGAASRAPASLSTTDERNAA